MLCRRSCKSPAVIDASAGYAIFFVDVHTFVARHRDVTSTCRTGFFLDDATSQSNICSDNGRRTDWLRRPAEHPTSASYVLARRRARLADIDLSH
jgi:hypothetical protein